MSKKTISAKDKISEVMLYELLFLDRNSFS